MKWDKMLGDAMTHRRTLYPQSLDTIHSACILSGLPGALARCRGLLTLPFSAQHPDGSEIKASL